VKLLFCILLSLFSAGLIAGELAVADDEGNEINVHVYPSDSDLLVIWLVDHDEKREMFEQMLNQVNAAGVEVWRVDILKSYFLPRSSETERTLPGNAVLALIQAAHKLRNKTIVLAAYDRMPLTLLHPLNNLVFLHL